MLTVNDVNTVTTRNIGEVIFTPEQVFKTKKGSSGAAVLFILFKTTHALFLNHIQIHI